MCRRCEERGRQIERHRQSDGERETLGFTSCCEARWRARRKKCDRRPREQSSRRKKKKKNRTRLRAVIPTAKEEWERGGKREDGY